nr:Zn-dependent hydrolase [Phyllobacterium zundukense]
MSSRSNYLIDADRLWDSLMEMAKIGPGIAGGNNRQTLTDEDSEGRRVFARWCAEAGLSIVADDVGNMFARRPGHDDAALPVYMGSHLDTQPTGGKYDGVLGVLAALEIVRTLNDLGVRTKRPIVIANWTNEEGARFAPAMLGSGVFVGAIDKAVAYSKVDAHGRTFGEELARIGWLGDENSGSRQMHSYFELHIEQGPILEAQQIDIGVVTHCQGLRWIEFTLTGKEAHTGSTPMKMRVNAGLAFARIADAVETVARETQPDTVGGIGQVNFSPNSRNVLPGRVVFTVDIRTANAAKLNEMEEKVLAAAYAICDELGVSLSFEIIGRTEPVTFSNNLAEIVRRCSDRLSYSHKNIISGAGHDACWASHVAPTVMIFCPCKGGVSHNETEEISIDWAAQGANVLLHSVLEVAQVV